MSTHALRLTSEDCRSAAGIQEAIDRVAAAGGGVVQLPEMDVTLDRGLELRSGVELRGCGDNTVLRKAGSRVYPLTGYHNYGMCDVPLHTTAGLEAGMTVSVLDDKRKGFYSTLARITWIDADGWVGLDHGIEADYIAADHPRLVTAYPLIFGHAISNASVRHLTLNGDLAQNPDYMDGCRGGCIYFARSHAIEVSDVTQADYNGEGLSFQMCSRMRFLGVSCTGNTGNGLHPGAGSTDVLFENCRGNGNRHSGFFFCVRANHITVRNCEFRDNDGPGISIGARDCHNLIEGCTIAGNGAAGILARATSTPIEVHSCAVRNCRINGNAHMSGSGQIDLQNDAHDIIIEGNMIAGIRGGDAVVAGDRVRNVFLADNHVRACGREFRGSGQTDSRPCFEYGNECCKPSNYRHLPGT